MRRSEVAKSSSSASFNVAGNVAGPVASNVSLRSSLGSPRSAPRTMWVASVVPATLHVRTDLHLARKTWHALMGCTIAFIFWAGMSISTAVTILGSILVWDLMMETARLKIPSFNEKIVRVWGPFMRACEVNRLSGIPHYLAATILAISIFPKPVAILSILYLALGDPIASLFGILYGSKGPRFASGKSLVGTAAGVLICALATGLFLKTLPISSFNWALLTLVGGLAGGTAELVPLEVDDNFSIPVISGFVLWLAFILIGT